MPQKRFSAEQIVALLRQIEVAIGQGKPKRSMTGARRMLLRLRPYGSATVLSVLNS